MMEGSMGGSFGNVAAAQSTSLQRLYHVQKRIVHAVQLAGGVMEELGNVGGSRADVVASQCREFMQSVKDIQVTLHEEIKAMCEYRSYENCDYIARIGAEISVNKLECVVDQLSDMQGTIKQYVSEKPS